LPAVRPKPAEFPEGSTDVECGNCGASLEFYYETVAAITKVIFIDTREKLRGPWAKLSLETLEKKDGKSRKSACPICAKPIPPSVLDSVYLPKGREHFVDCPSCNAALTVEYRASIRMKKIDVTDAARVEFDCPSCDTSTWLIDLEIELEAGTVGVECGECKATLEVSWSNWGDNIDAELLEESEGSSHSRKRSHKEIVAPCPKCGRDIAVENDADSGECENCGAGVEITYSSEGKKIHVEVTEFDDLEISCPECGDDVTIEGDEIDAESGNTEITCEGCEAELEVSWSRWGEEYKVGVLEEGEPVEEEDEDEDLD